MKRSARFLIFFAVFVLILGYTAAATGGKDALAGYVAGCRILESSREVPDSVKTGYYRELCHLTGYDAERAVRALRSYRSRPEAWQQFLQHVTDTLTTLMDNVPIRTDSLPLSQGEVKHGT